MRTRSSLLALVITTACTAAPASSPDAAMPDAAREVDAGPPSVDAALDAFVPGSETVTLTSGPYHLAQGVEQTFCITLDLGNDAPMMIRAVRTHISTGSHHLVVSRADGSPIDPTPTPCAPLTHGTGQAIFIAESPEGSLAYPSDAGLPVTAHQPIGIELHMIDLEPDAIDVVGSVDLDLVPLSPSIREVQILFTGDLSLTLPPHVDTTVSSLFPMTPGTEVLAMTTHTHQLGIDATLDITTSASDPGTRVHESLSWSDPPLTRFDPPLVMGPSDQVRLTCTFRNTTSSTVYFGTGFDDEMCFFWAYYLDPA